MPQLAIKSEKGGSYLAKGGRKRAIWLKIKKESAAALWQTSLTEILKQKIWEHKLKKEVNEM